MAWVEAERSCWWDTEGGGLPLSGFIQGQGCSITKMSGSERVRAKSFGWKLNLLVKNTNKGGERQGFVAFGSLLIFVEVSNDIYYG